MLKTQNLTFFYPKENPPALAGVDLSLPAGGFITLCGVSGCGKSTLLKTLKPCITPHGRLSGEIFFEGEPLSVLAPRKAAEYIGYVSQNPEAQTVTDKVWHEAAFGLESIGLKGGEIRRRVAECAEYFGISAIFERDTATLSGGEKQLLALASAAALHPKLLLLDEPTNDIDVNTLRALEEGLEDFAGCAVVVSHDRWFLDRICTHILSFEGDGNVVFYEGSYSDYEDYKRAQNGGKEPPRRRYRKLME